MNCRFCGHSTEEIIDLGMQPASNDFTDDGLSVKLYPLKVVVCTNCFLVQTKDVVSPEIMFNESYPYFSGQSPSWVKHCEDFAETYFSMYADHKSVLEIASNDGTGLLPFIKMGCNVTGIDPSESVAQFANDSGVLTYVDFFTYEWAKDIGEKYDIIIARNVLAHVPYPVDFVKGIKECLSDNGVVVFEFPSVIELIKNNQFDTIYHEHYSYLSSRVVIMILSSVGLYVNKIEKINTHGGSIRLFARHEESIFRENVSNYIRIEELEVSVNLQFYKSIKKSAEKVRSDFMKFLGDNFERKIMGYGAAAKANTILNFCEIDNYLINCISDISKYKQGKKTPGTDIPILGEEYIEKYKPDFIVILPWNLKDQISERLSFVREWGCKFVVAIPELEIF